MKDAEFLNFVLSDGTAEKAAPERSQRRSIHGGGSYERWHLDPLPVQEEEGWLIVYLDVITLLLVMMVVMLAFSEPISHKPKTEQPPTGLQTPATNAATPSDQGQEMQPSSVATPVPATATDPLAGLPLGGLGQDIEVVVDQGTVSFRINSEILFPSGEAGLTTAGQAMIDRLLPVFNQVPDHLIVVEGHTDNVPIQTARFPSNWELAAGRAGSVVRHLQSRGLNPTRLRATGYADTRPLEPNSTPDGRAANRRVELVMEAPKATR